jgi:hypothetical protein
VRTGRQLARRSGARATALLVALASTAVAGSPATAAPALLACPTQGAHHVRYVTAVRFVSSHNCGAPDPADLYQGWIGINGRIMTPESVFLWDSTKDLAMGSIAMVRYAPNGRRTAWMRIGWFTGRHPSCHPTANGEFELFVEATTDGTNVNCFNVSPLAKGGSVIYRIQRDPVHQCWNAYYNYDQPAMLICGMPVAMTAEVSNYLENNTGNSSLMPRTVFGAADPDTNDAVRLMGANGYEPWDMSLTAGATFVQDERVGEPPTYRISAYAPYYYAWADSG